MPGPLPSALLTERKDNSIVEKVTTCYAISNRTVLELVAIRDIQGGLSMASAETQLPTCPVCSRSDQVKTLQAAYESGVDKAAPPDMPTKRILMMPYIFTCSIFLGLCIFFVIVLIGGLEGKMPVLGQYILLGLTLICLVTTLITSYFAFQRVVQGDAQATVLFPAWDRAMATWKSMYYCARDNVVFDPKTNKTLNNEQLAKLRSIDEGSVEVQAAAIAKH
jgi:hypothetical protein